MVIVINKIVVINIDRYFLFVYKDKVLFAYQLYNIRESMSSPSSTVLKTAISVGLGALIAVSPLRNSRLANFIIIITGG